VYEQQDRKWTWKGYIGRKGIELAESLGRTSTYDIRTSAWQAPGTKVNTGKELDGIFMENMRCNPHGLDWGEDGKLEE